MLGSDEAEEGKVMSMARWPARAPGFDGRPMSYNM